MQKPIRSHSLATELESLKQQGLYRKLRVLEGKPEAHTTFDHKSVVNLSSNNYLGLTTHPKLVKAALDAVEKFGVGSGAVRTISGTMEMHMELERRLAKFKHVESVVVFQSGFAANAGTVAAVLTKDDVIISDELNHASIIDGCRLEQGADQGVPAQGRRRGAQDHARSCPPAQKKILITDGVFSMDGDLGRVPELSRARRRVRRDHDGRRCACERRVWEERQRHRRSLQAAMAASTSRSARCRRRSACSAATSPARRT